MTTTQLLPDLPDVLGNDRIAFYRRCIDSLADAGIPCLVGGAYALCYYTGITRDTKDLDLFVRPTDVQRSLDVLTIAGYETKVACPAWLAKVFHGAAFVDIIYRSGNGAAQVDDRWFEQAERMRLFDTPVAVVPVEEMIWSKAFTMERERFDLADVVHLIQARGHSLDWQHLLQRFATHWRVLMAHVVLYQYAFPGESRIVPHTVIEQLTERLRSESEHVAEDQRVCRGTLLSGSQYLIDTLFRGYQDARFHADNHNGMTEGEVTAWKEYVAKEQGKRLKDAALIPPVKPASLAQQVHRQVGI